MADIVPQNFPIIPESSVSSYSYEDIANGLGYTIFYGCGTETSGSAISRFLTPVALNPDPNLTTTNITDNATDTNVDTSPFNTPRTVKGTAYVYYQIVKNTTSTHTLTMKFQKVSSSTTDISSTITSRSISASGTTEDLIPIPLTETDFKVGDYIRLVVNIADASGTASISLDPQTPTLTTHIPFKIAL